MQLIGCTAKLRKEMGLKPSDLFPGEAPTSTLGPWHANLIHVGRRKCVLFANDRTLFNFIAPDVSRDKIRRLGELFLDYLNPVLVQEGFPSRLREIISAEYSEVAFTKAHDKSVLGSMNDLAFHYEDNILSAGGVHSPEVPRIISTLNRMPMGAIKYSYPVEALKAIYGIPA
jgi:hypothetical protein